MATWLPWRDHHSDLTLARLVKVGDLFRNVWLRCSELHEPDAGDGKWSLSCRAFQRSCYQLALAQQDWPWLTVQAEHPMRLIVGIGFVPVRFYHGDSEYMPRNYTSAADKEVDMRQLLDFGDNVKTGMLLRFATETDAKGVPLSVKLVQYEESINEIKNAFDIPEAEEQTATGVVTFPTPQPMPGVTQPKPSARPRSGLAKGQSDIEHGK